jgi:hypothetical protein
MWARAEEGRHVLNAAVAEEKCIMDGLARVNRVKFPSPWLRISTFVKTTTLAKTS